MTEQDEKIFIFKAGDPSTCAYLIKDTPIYVENEHVPPVKIELNNLVSGVVELFLTEGGKCPPRLFSLSIEPGGEIKPVDFKIVLETAQKYEFGFSANRFIAILIDRTNDLLREAVQKLPPEWQQYRERANFFADLVNKLAAIASVEKIGDFLRLVDRSKRTQLYRDGMQFKRERAISRIAVDPEFEGAAVRFAKDTVLCRGGDSADCIYILLEGTVYVSKQDQIIANIAQPGECFGELAFFLHGKRTADLVASAKTAILKIDKGKLKDFHAQHQDMFVQIANTLAKRLRQNVAHLVYYSSDEPVESIKQFKKRAANAKKEIDGFIGDLKGFVRIAFNREVNVLLSSAAKNKALRD